MGSMEFIKRFFGKSSPERFSARLIKALREAGDTDELRYDAAEHRILRLRDGEAVGTINLANMYGNYRRLPRARRSDYRRACVRTALVQHKKLPNEFEAASPDLRPRLWARADLEHHQLLKLLGDPAGGQIHAPSEPVGEHLIASLVYDWPDCVQDTVAENLAGWGVTFYEAMEVARQNPEDATSAYGQLGDHLYAFASGDSYDATRLMLVQRLQDLEVSGKPVAMVPNRDSLLIAGSEDEVGLKIMAELAREGLQESYDLSGSPLILADGVWVDWMPPADRPWHRHFRDLETNWIGPELPPVIWSTANGSSIKRHMYSVTIM